MFRALILNPEPQTPNPESRFPRRQTQQGFSMIEVLAVILIIGVIAGLIGYFFGNSGPNANRELVALERIAQAIEEARQNARIGLEDRASRTVNFQSLNLSKRVRLVTEVSANSLPTNTPVLNPNEPLVFEIQSGRTAQNRWGLIIVEDTTTRRARALLITTSPAPIQRFARFGANGKFESITTQVY
ncbi:MAG: type II secretion system protein [Acidobacteria bacterium]|nr:type II secretion system protein [Acidobacteriota bacterium]